MSERATTTKEPAGQEVVFPEAVTRFIRANPDWTDRFLHLGLPRERLYFQERVLADWAQLRPFFPAAPRRVLDIGSGIGGIDLLIWKSLGRPSLTLVDKSDRLDAGVAHDVIGAARRFLTANGVEDAAVTTLCAQDPATPGTIARERYDLVLSLRGLGFIFPYDFYAEPLRAALAPGGRLILDLWPDSRAIDPVAEPHIRARFEAAGFPTADDVIARLEKDFGKVLVVRRRAFARVCAVRG